MGLTEVETEKVPGRISHVYIGYNDTHGVDIKSGIASFEYRRMKELVRLKVPGNPTASIVQQLGCSYFTWKLRFLSDCRQAFFATDVDDEEGNQFALVDDGLSNKIEYFRVVTQIVDGSGDTKTRIYTVTNGYALRNNGKIGEDEDAFYEYEGEADYISYSDV